MFAMTVLTLPVGIAVALAWEFVPRLFGMALLDMAFLHPQLMAVVVWSTYFLLGIAQWFILLPQLASLGRGRSIDVVQGDDS